jgi:hypothetical protein
MPGYRTLSLDNEIKMQNHSTVRAVRNAKPENDAMKNLSGNGNMLAEV